jgi:hypothetical protein
MGTYYHYCQLPSATFDAFVAGPAMGQFINQHGIIDCRPTFESGDADPIAVKKSIDLSRPFFLLRAAPRAHSGGQRHLKLQQDLTLPRWECHL